jgi:hypothetical protein
MTHVIHSGVTTTLDKSRKEGRKEGRNSALCYLRVPGWSSTTVVVVVVDSGVDESCCGGGEDA